MNRHDNLLLHMQQKGCTGNGPVHGEVAEPG
jgi:hypothetical protein